MSDEEKKENGNVLLSQASDSVKLMNMLKPSFFLTFTSWAVIRALTTLITVNSTPIFSSFLALPSRLCLKTVERFSYDIEMKTREQNRSNKRTEIERFDWFIERIQTRVAFGWLSERSGEKTSCPRTF